ncbi:Putative 2-aminoethylphosphonate transport system permease protein PhnV [Thalassocella blandensis]|nr:Putative 2-aminoethylphosphonate transport system permease protein PhnV [Thalassocella blandensis]
MLNQTSNQPEPKPVFSHWQFRFHSKRALWYTLTLVLAACIALPMFYIISGLFEPAGASWKHLQHTVLSSLILNTALLMVQVAVYTSVLGIGTAWLISATDFPGRRIFSWALFLPLATPSYIVAYVYTDLLDFSGPVQSTLRQLFDLQPGQYYFPKIRSLPGAAFVISLVLYPYVYLLTRTAFSQRSSTLFNAARSLGASPSRAFLRIALPAARPAIFGGLALVLMETLADFGVVEYFGIPTFSTGIFRTWYALGDHAGAVKLAGIMFVFVVALVLLEKYNRKGITARHSRDYANQAIPLHGAKAIAAIFICLCPILLGCLIPLARLLYLASTSGDNLFGTSYWELIENSVSVATIASITTIVIALYFTLSQRIFRSRLTNFFTGIATMGYALPGVLLAVGLLAPVTWLDRQLADFFLAHFDWHSGLLLTGTTFILIYAYSIRFLTVAYNSCASGLDNIPPTFEHVARSLGANPRRLIQSILLPMLRKPLFVASILLFVDTLRELPATLMLRPFNFETLATRVYRLASDERLAEASTAAITIVIIGLIPILIMNRLADKEFFSSTEKHSH